MFAQPNTAFNSRLESLTPQLTRIARNAAGSLSEHTPEDLLQTAYVKLLERADSFTGRPDVELLTFAKWRSLQQAERGRTYTRYCDAEQYLADEDGDEISEFELIASDATNPEDRAVETETVAEIEAAFAKLDPTNQTIAHMLFEGYTGQEIAAALKISEGAVSQRKRAIKRSLALVL